ncbi:MAG TPA: DUF1697 domain-containing protein [Actinomycetota bacterium]|jgi:uncharacterized protein (DUF1697 family)|nr:DUF1697 domain-containing protein [Actinomycetota bacterium]
MRYVALLRGINVGGKNLISMPALKASFEDLGFTNVSTYIQSGNVLFDGTGKASDLTRRIEAAISKAFGVEIAVVLRSRKQMAKIVTSAPKGFGSDPVTFRYDVTFLKEPLRATAALTSLSLKEGVDLAWPGPGVLYTSRLAAKATQSRLGRIVGTPIYKQMTIRNWNTTTKLRALLG